MGIGSLRAEIPSNMLFGGAYQPGASLRGWRDFFPNAQILGLDVDASILFEEERIRTRACNTLSTRQVSSVVPIPATFVSWHDHTNLYSDCTKCLVPRECCGLVGTGGAFWQCWHLECGRYKHLR